MVPSINKETAISTDLVPSTSKEMATSTMVSSTGAEMAKSTVMVSSSKGKEKAISGNNDSFNVANPWLYKEFRLAKQLQLKEYLQADDMYSDMRRLADLYSGIKAYCSPDTLLALPLTVDLKPNVPREIERIRRHKGCLFALRNEPRVHRVWLPKQNAPGLAMSRALGDYCLKNYGVISEPEVTYRRLTKKDEFVVLATDGVWDVLTNEQVVEIVASTPDKSQVARVVVERAARVENQIGGFKAR
ncbi:hypothetical protein L7F22_054728 [Adiantum nelumboides]|nr:hypothetical protein [Adiantum nelumboides]